LTPQQKIYFDAIKKYIAKNGCSPSYADIGTMVGVTSLATVSKMVDRLIHYGYLTKGLKGARRSINIVPAKLHGYNMCDRGHEEIYFKAGVCPLCVEIQKRVPPREVSYETN